MCQLGIFVRPTIPLAAVNRIVLALLNPLILLMLRHSGRYEWAQQDWLLLIKPEPVPFASP
jgi:hypothetical protein